MNNDFFFISLREKYLEIQECDYVQARDVESVKNIAEQVLENEHIDGTAVDFHNFAVTLAELNQNELACNILERGISTYSNCVDLLADYLIYGGGFEGPRGQCEKYYEVLQKIPDRLWTWRGYAFSLDYLQSKIERTNNREDIEQIEKIMNRIVKAYYSKFPNDERPYLAEAELYRGIDPEKEREVIEKAVLNLGSCPECSLRYADILLSKSNDINDCQKAVKYLDNALHPTNRNIDIAYAQFLRGMCLIRLLDRKFSDKEKVEEIYKCFRTARHDALKLTPINNKIIEKQIGILEVLSDVDY
jgi:tetratricopeptide (TPR) repeat protein